MALLSFYYGDRSGHPTNNLLGSTGQGSGSTCTSGRGSRAQLLTCDASARGDGHLVCLDGVPVSSLCTLGSRPPQLSRPAIPSRRGLMNDCLFGCTGAVGIFSLDEGCVVWPNVHTQILCWQHAKDARSQGAHCCIQLVQDLTNGWFARRWES